MKRQCAAFLIAAAGVSLLIVLAGLSRHAAHVRAAPDASHDPFHKLPHPAYAPLRQGEQAICTVTYTTTDSLDNVNACPVGESVMYCAERRATILAPYDDLALIAEIEVPVGGEMEAPVHEDWFRLDAYEPNNSFAEATAEGPTLPVQVPLTLELTFHEASDVDYFRYYVKAGRWYEARTSDLNLVDTLVEIYDEDQTRVERDDDGAGGLASRACWRADYDGYYFIVVQNNVASAGTYNLTLDETPGPTPPPTDTPWPRTDVLFLPLVLKTYPWHGPTPTPETPTPTPSRVESEPNDDFDHADVVAPSWTIYGTAWNSITDTDFFVLDTRVGYHHLVDLVIDSPDGLQLRLVLYNGDRERIKSSSFSSTRVDLGWAARTPTTYIQVDPLALPGVNQTASYRLDIATIVVSPTPTPTPRFAQDAYEPNDSLAEAYALPPATSIALDGLTFYPAADEDWFSVWVKEGQHWRCSTSDLHDVDTHLEVYDQDDTLIGWDDDGGTGFASELTWRAQDDGRHTVHVTDLAGGVGAYDLRCELTTDTVVAVEPAERIAGRWQIFDVQVTVANVIDLAGYQFELWFNPSVVEVRDLDYGDFLATSDRTLIEVDLDVDNEAGRVTVELTSIGEEPGAHGSGDLVEITLRAIAYGSTPLDLYDVRIYDSGGSQMERNVENGRVEVPPPSPTPIPTEPPTATPDVPTPTPTMGTPTPVPPLPHLKLGILGPFSGPSSRTGDEFRAAATMALDAIDWQIGAYAIVPVWIDSQSDPAKASLAYERAVLEDEIDAAMMNWHSSVAVSCMEVAAQHSIPHFCPFGATAVVNEIWRSNPDKYYTWVNKWWPTPESLSVAYVQALEAAIANGSWQPESRTVAIYGEETDWGRSFGRAVKGHFQDAGWEIVAEEYTEVDRTDFYPVLNKFKACDPAVIAGTMISPPAFSAFIKQADEVGLESVIIADGLEWIGPWYELIGEASNHVLDQRPRWVTEQGQQFASDFEHQKGFVPRPWAAGMAFDAANYVIQVAESVYDSEGELTSETLRAFARDEIQTGDWSYDDGIMMERYRYTPETVPDPVVGEGAYTFPVLQYIDGEGRIIFPPAWAEQPFTPPGG